MCPIWGAVILQRLRDHPNHPPHPTLTPAGAEMDTSNGKRPDQPHHFCLCLLRRDQAVSCPASFYADTGGRVLHRTLPWAPLPPRGGWFAVEGRCEMELLVGRYIHCARVKKTHPKLGSCAEQRSSVGKKIKVTISFSNATVPIWGLNCIFLTTPSINPAFLQVTSEPTSPILASFEIILRQHTKGPLKVIGNHLHYKE